jgi:hypothetical protein
MERELAVQPTKQPNPARNKERKKTQKKTKKEETEFRELFVANQDTPRLYGKGAAPQYLHFDHNFGILNYINI